MRISLLITAVLWMTACKYSIHQELYVTDVSQPAISLNGTWKVNTSPPAESWRLDKLDHSWKNIQVPGELMMQGFPIKHDIPFVYKKQFDIPREYDGKNIMIRFDGVYSYARVWVNGNYVRDHWGGFTSWQCDITPFVKAGEHAMLTVEVTDRADEISYASGYAKHQIGGILRNVTLLALPENYPEQLVITTALDDDFHDATLLISGSTRKSAAQSEIRLELFNPDYKQVELENASIKLTSGTAFQVTNEIHNPDKWDAEHPNLYRLRVSFSEKGSVRWQKEYRIGFREITLNGNRLLVNGKEVKLRGANRHDIHPLLGRVSTPDYELKDVLLAREANMNFIRTSHYPPTENFLRLCDEYGLYVEDETAVCFVGSHRTADYHPGSTENDSSFMERYLSQLAEMVHNHRNHPSVLIWSIGNENYFGNNFKQSYDWVKKTDPTRPVIYSYPGDVPDSITAYDILSMHYPGLTGNMTQWGKRVKAFGHESMPVIFDEWAHVACYTKYTLMEDPNIRDFWGISLDSMWQKTFESDGGLGGAIWGMIDETFMLPDSLPGYDRWWGKNDKNILPADYAGHTVGYGAWGIIDTWRRKKPEFWNTKKAYSPVKLAYTKIVAFSPDTPLEIPLQNRFDHTNIDELRIVMEYRNRVTILSSPSIAPHNSGSLHIPMKQWEPDEKIMLRFYDATGLLVDQYALHLAAPHKTAENPGTGEIITVEEEEGIFSVNCDNGTRVIFDKKSGLISEIRKPSGTNGLSGPHLNLRTKGKYIVHSCHLIDDHGTSWQLEHFHYKIRDDEAIIAIAGIYDSIIPVEYRISIGSNGKIRINYKVDQVPAGYIREIGLRFDLDHAPDLLSWEREGYWSYYPPSHLSATEGSTILFPEKLKLYREEPGKDWVHDTKSFYYEGTEDERPGEQLSYMAKSTKEHLCGYHLHYNGARELSVTGNGDISCRLTNKNSRLQLFINNEMDYVDLSWGNYQRQIQLDESYSNQVFLQIDEDSQ
ncbi:MAG: glycoside hydrolase family 2 TIM barrel-domain containing protein [Bacteroidota bacterium]